MMKDLAVRAGFVSEGNNGNSFNPLGTHSLRESFGSLMINSGVPDTIVDFWLGHAIDDQDRAYKTTRFESLKKMYAEREHLLSISTAKPEVVGELKESLKGVDKAIKAVTEDLNRKNELLKNKVKSLETQIANIYDYVQKNLDPLLDVVNAIAETEEGEALLKKIRKKIQEEKQAKTLRHIAEADREQPDGR